MNSDDDYVDVVKMMMKECCLCDDDQIDDDGIYDYSFPMMVMITDGVKDNCR